MQRNNAAVKGDCKKVLVILWELLGLFSIAMLLYLPNGNTIISNMLTSLNIETGKWNGLKYENIALIVVFLLVYFTSYKLLARYKSTKMFSLLSSVLMVVTLITLMMFTV